ncbi:organic hydroperoxide resistance protein [Cylindrobasidium torrendii FP15055 ss-10]|uniref:Organic hydroperoxide resistance protein n=1 Tax=Cylindrobasidium torrendii FP15055 ss-10 TaxID=1314674 RepID=A0A0D7BJB0_9AGAR|nr:organic hydroperoxide resistance protein [Cylindrobasidium torrendii FP15055 ss-10]
MSSFLTAARFSSRAITRPSIQTSRRTFLTLENHKYTATAVASGAGRNGTVTSNGLKLNLAMPKELGGSGNGENPEQLFAMGYSSCLLGAIQAVARQAGKPDAAKDAKVHVSVHLGEPTGMPGFGIGADVKVEGVDDELLQKAHEFCPYSRALKYGVNVQATAA